jgi:competence protein ComEA
MRSRSLAAQHDAAVARRLELLTSELAAVRGPEAGGDTQMRPAESWSPQAHTRIRAVPDLDEGDAEPAEVSDRSPSVVRLPGRHASRRSKVVRLAVPEAVRGRIALGPGQVVVVAVLAVVGLVLTCWWLVRGQGHEVIAPPAVSTVSDALATPATSRGPTAAAGAKASPAAAKVVVDVTGRVRHPGIAVLRQGARVIDALHAAGGARPGVDLSGLNLARVLTDGEQVVVGAAAAPGAPGMAASGVPSGAPVAALVNINTADETTLESLPEIGPVTAQAIITWRTQNGAFGSVDQLLDVDGIGDATLSKLTPYVTI